MTEGGVSFSAPLSFLTAAREKVTRPPVCIFTLCLPLKAAWASPAAGARVHRAHFSSAGSAHDVISLLQHQRNVTHCVYKASSCVPLFSFPRTLGSKKITTLAFISPSAQKHLSERPETPVRRQAELIPNQQHGKPLEPRNAELMERNRD